MEVVGAENTQWTPEDRELVEAVARQVATQVENLRLLAQSDHYRTEAEQAMRRVTREGWNEYTQRTELRTGYVYMDDAVLPETTAPALASPVMQPLSVRGESIGEVAVEAEEAELPLDAQRILAAVADQLSAHIENLRLTERTENALTMTQRLYQVTSRINAAGNWNEVLNAVGDNLRLPGINRLVMFEHEVNAETNELIATTAVAGWYSGEGAPLGPLPRRYEGAVFNVFKLMLSPTPIFFNDLDTDPRVDPNTLEASRRLQVRAVATLPLRVAGRMVGTLLLQSEQPRTFTEAELEPFLAVVDTLAVALDNLRLTRQTQAALAETEKLYVSNARLSAATTLDEALQAAAQPGITLGADSARLFIMNLNVAGQPEAITLAAAWQRVGDPLIPVGARFNLADFAYSQVWLADKYNPLLIENANTDSRLDPAARAIYLQSQTVGSVLLPLTVDNRWVGLVLVNWAEPHKFTEADQRLYRTLAGQAAVVVNNRLLFEEAQRRARREALINTITQKIQNTASIETALQTAIQEVGLALKAQQTRVEFGVSGQPGDVKPNGAPANGGARTRSTL
jgi:GAF domain-containing protein